MKNLQLLPAVIFFIHFNLSNCKIADGQNVFIPDANFKAALLGNPAINTNADAEIQTSEATTFNGEIFVDNLNISDLTGIEMFVNIWQLNVDNNSLVTLNVSSLLNLGSLSFQNNLITSIDLTNNSALAILLADNNQLTNIDISQNTSLVQLNLQNNLLNTLEITSNTALIDVYCGGNQLTNLVVSSNQAIEVLWCQENYIATLNISNNPALTELNCVNNQLSTLDVSQNNNLTLLYCGGNQLSTLDLSANTSLSLFECSGNQLTSLDVSLNTNLTLLSCGGNQLTTLNVLTNSALSQLSCNSNQLNLIDVSSNTDLIYLDCSNNQLSMLDLSANFLLSDLNCSNNILANLDFSANTLVEYLNCSVNQLTSLNIQNGNNVNLNWFDATNNPSLSCIKVDDISYMNANWIAGIDVGASFNTSCSVCVVNIPDVNFKAALLADMLINTNQNSEIECAEASSYTGTIGVISANITDMTGIEAFVNITNLNCDFNQITSLDVSANTSLTELWCVNNLLTSLDVSSNVNLWALVCGNNPISNLTLPASSTFADLICANTQLSAIDLSAYPNFIILNVDDNSQLNTLNFQNGNNANVLGFTALNCPLLNCIQVDDTAYANANWSANITAPTSFSTSCSVCTVNIPSPNFKAALLANTALNANGNNEIECSEAAAFADTLVFNTIGIADFTGIESFTSLVGLKLINMYTVSVLNLTNCVSLQYLEISSSGGTWNATVDLSNCTQLKYLKVQGAVYPQNWNGNSLDFSNNNQLLELSIVCPPIDSVNISNCFNLNTVSIEGASYVDLPHPNIINNLSLSNYYQPDLDSLDLTGCDSLKSLKLQFTDLNFLDLSDCINLEYFYSDMSIYETLLIQNNPTLKHMYIFGADDLSNLNLSTCTSLEGLFLHAMTINDVDFSYLPQLDTLDVEYVFCSTINLTSNTDLKYLDCSHNSLSSLDLSLNTLLLELNANDNSLLNLNLQNGNNNLLQDFDATDNPLLSCVQVDDVNFMNANWNFSIDNNAFYSISCAGACLGIPLAFNANNTTLNSMPMVATFNNNTPNPNNYDFVWYFGDGTILASDDASVNHSYYFNGIYSVSLVAFDHSNGCYDTLYVANLITCNSAVANSCNHTAITNPGGVINACYGSIIPINGNTSAINPSYQWNRDGVIISGASQDHYDIDQNGNYTLTVFNSQGCPKSSSPVQVNYSLQSSILPTITASGPANNCGDVNVTLSASGSFTNYIWSTGQSGNSINVTQGGSYSVTGQSSACDATSLPYNIMGSAAPVPSICMITVDETDNKNVLIWEKPVSLEIDSFLILREDINTPGVYNIINAQSYVELSEFKDLSSVADERAYSYKLAVMDTCGGVTVHSASQKSMHLDVTQGNSILSRILTWSEYLGQPQPYTHYLIYRETAPGNLNLLLIDSVPNTQTWYIDTTLTGIADTARAYKIGYRINTPCVSTRNQNNICSSNVTANKFPVQGLDVGIHKITAHALNFRIYPNPNNGIFNIVLPEQSIAKKLQVVAYTLLGEQVYDQNFTGSKNISIDLHHLAGGVYFIGLSDEKNSIISRLIISK